MKYPQMYKDFMSDMKALVVGGKRWAEEKKFLDTKTNDDLVQESFFDLSPQKVNNKDIRFFTCFEMPRIKLVEYAYTINALCYVIYVILNVFLYVKVLIYK